MVVAGIGGGSATAAEVPGDATRGQAVFTAKQCVRCHAVRGQLSVGPAIDELRRPEGAYELAGRFWNHAPAMFTTLRRDGIAWPEIAPAEMADLRMAEEARRMGVPYPRFTGEQMGNLVGLLRSTAKAPGQPTVRR